MKRIAATVLGMAQTRLELIGIELAQARQTALVSVAWALLLAFSVAFALLFLGFAVIAWGWDSYRIQAILACAAFYLLLGLCCYLRLKNILALQGPMFEDTVAELGRDKAAVLASLSHHPTKE